MTLSTIHSLAVFLFAHHVHPNPQVVLGGDLPPGAVARFGPNAFRYAGWGGQIAYSPDGKQVAVTTNAGVVVFDAGTGKSLLRIGNDDLALSRLLRFTPGGEIVVVCRRRWDDGGASILRIDTGTGKVTAKFVPRERLWFGAASPDGKVAFARTHANEFVAETVAIEIDTGKELWRKLHPEMSQFRVSPDGSRMVTWSWSAKLTMDVLDTATGKTVETFVHPETDSHPCGSVAVGPKAARIVVAHSWSRGFSVYETGTAKPVLRVTGWWYENAFLLPEGKSAVFGRGRGGDRLEVWNLAEQKLTAAVACPSSSGLSLAPDGTTLAAVSYQNPGVLAFLDVATGKPRPFSPEPFTQAAVVWYLPDGTLASADEKLTGPVKWDAKTGAMTALPAGTKPLAPPKPGSGFKPPEGTDQIVMSPDGKRAVGYRFDPDELDSSPGDTYIGLFDGDGRVVMWYPRPDHTSGAKWAMSPDSKAFAIARGDGTITLFESETGKELRTLRHSGWVTSLAFSPDSRSLATACGDGPILVWDVRPRMP